MEKEEYEDYMVDIIHDEIRLRELEEEERLRNEQSNNNRKIN